MYMYLSNSTENLSKTIRSSTDTIDDMDTNLVVLHDVLDEEPVGVVPRQEDVLHHVTHALLLEAKVVSAHHRRVDQVKPVNHNADVTYSITNGPTYR